jgi:hypothetical protein
LLQILGPRAGRLSGFPALMFSLGGFLVVAFLVVAFLVVVDLGP